MEAPQPNQAQPHYNYGQHQMHHSMMNTSMNQKPHYQNTLPNGVIGGHSSRGQVPGSNIQAVDMDVNEILKVIFNVH